MDGRVGPEDDEQLIGGGAEVRGQLAATEPSHQGGQGVGPVVDRHVVKLAGGGRLNLEGVESAEGQDCFVRRRADVS